MKTEENIENYSATSSNEMSSFDLLTHYFGNSGRALTLHDIGVHERVRELIKKPDAFKGLFESKDGTSVQSRFISQIQNGNRISFENTYDFRTPSSSFNDPLWAIGGATVSGRLHVVSAVSYGQTYQLSAIITYKLYDRFSDPVDLLNVFPGEWDPGTPFDITGQWTENVNFSVSKYVYENKIKPNI
ncbi:hypothetical protein [Xenorhabdus sp. SGI246]|uniref:hypothetical protein n=1 Tax=Xenorhabdus sp. SGI246 TaxID=3158263 RepID=UPI00349FBC30